MPVALRRLCLLLALPAALASAQSAAPPDAYAQVRQLLDQGQAAQALERAEAYLATLARDPQMRFLRAAALADSGAQTQAEAALRELTREHPELPEPYNNLAVIYASQGRLDEAHAALESALRNNPQYATAWENLGDIHVRLARRAYARAQQGPDASAAAARKQARLQGALHEPAPAAAGH